MLRTCASDECPVPKSSEDGQYAWGTEFGHVGLQATLPGDIGLLAQWMRGSTVMGPLYGDWYPVDVEYRAEYAMPTRRFDRNRTSARYDPFVVAQYDELPEDNNTENGHAWTLSYQYQLNDHTTLAAEWLSIKSRHLGWLHVELDPTRTERQAQLAVRFSF